MTLEGAFRHTKAARPIINPNVGFLEQLTRYEMQATGGVGAEWQDHTMNGVTKRLPTFIIADANLLQEYEHEFH